MATFFDLREEFLDGKKLRRGIWSDDGYISRVSDDLFGMDLTKDDWEVVEEKPLPCPFCGSDDIATTRIQVYCRACGANGPNVHPKHPKKALVAWNSAKR